jgi:hypothetical protein
MTKIQRYMKERFIVSKIEMAQDGSPSVYVGFNDPAEHKSGEAKPLNPFGPKATAFSSPEDLPGVMLLSVKTLNPFEIKFNVQRKN